MLRLKVSLKSHLSLYKSVVTNSVAYMMMSRLGLDTEYYFENEDFSDVTNFNTQETLNALGFASSDIAEMGLTEIAKTIAASIVKRKNKYSVVYRYTDEHGNPKWVAFCNFLICS